MKRFLNATVLIGSLVLSVHARGDDASLLRPPPGAKVAIVMFADLQCPDCSQAYLMVVEAANAHKIPAVLHDFPLPRHNWAFDAAMWARFFDKVSGDLGNAFRKFIYAHQPQITRENLQLWVEKFGDENKTAVPLAMDADGKLRELVRADYSLGQRVGVQHTPTIWVVGNGGVSQPFVEEVKDWEKLGQMIEDMLNKAEPAVPAKSNSAPKGAIQKKTTVNTPKKTG
jgi:protein-disulfide isomerase